MKIPVEIFKTHPDAQIPQYESTGACAFDLSPIEDATIKPNEIVRLKTGLIICVPENYTLILAARSSTPKKYGINIPQGFGIVDTDYCGPSDEILLQLRNFSDQTIQIKKGQRIAQGMLVPVIKAQFKVIKNISKPDRGGFGSTG